MPPATPATTAQPHALAPSGQRGVSCSVGSWASIATGGGDNYYNCMTQSTVTAIYRKVGQYSNHTVGRVCA